LSSESEEGCSLHTRMSEKECSTAPGSGCTTPSLWAPLTENEMAKICSKAPQPWQKPRARIYDYNRILGNEYYQPMIEYILDKEEYTLSPIQKQTVGDSDLHDFVIKGYAKTIKERNKTTANVHYNMLHGSLESTDFSKDNLLNMHAPAIGMRNRWMRELLVMSREDTRRQDQRNRRERWAKEDLEERLAREEEIKRLQDPQVVANLRASAKAATQWCHRTPLTKEQRRALLEEDTLLEEGTQSVGLLYPTC